ncbi:MAG: hypothetical protein P1S59_09695 [bacterium]|nr:hypothetical protein [bacterium]
MKSLSSRMKVLLVLAICAAFIVPSVVSAGEVENPLLKGLTFEKGDYSVPAPYARSAASLVLNKKTSKIEFMVENGDSNGKNRVSSVKIVLLDENGKERAVAITPDQFNQKVGSAVGTLGKEAIEGLTNLNLDIKVRGPKGGFMVLDVTEYYEADVVCPWYSPFCND